MIFEQTLKRELNYTAGAVFLVFLTIMLTTLVIRVLGQAAGGKTNPSDVLVLIGLATLGYLAILLMITLFVSILIVLMRWYKDSEMVVWFASGLSLRDFIKPILSFCLPFFILITFLSFVGWPWANAQTSLLKDRFEQRDDISMIAPGQFRESAGAGRVFFIESINKAATMVENVFVSSTQNGKLGVAVAKQGAVENQANGDKFIILEKGRRYEGEPNKPDFKILEFERYGVKILSKTVNDNGYVIPKNRTTPQLLANPEPLALGELVWRIGLPLLSLSLVLTAIPLAYLNPRRGRYSVLIYAVLIYLIYNNLLSLSQAWVQSGKVTFALGWWPLHALGLLGAAALFYFRQSNLTRRFWRRTPVASVQQGAK